MILPTATTRYRVPRRVLHATRRLLQPSRRARVEGVVVWFGSVGDDDMAEIVSAYRPGQRAYRSDYGLSVEVPQEAITEMIEDLPSGLSVLVRLHTHGGAAYHSEMDDANMLLAHQGAISIVIPEFAKKQIELARCSINMLDHQRGWVELSAADVRARFEVVDA